MCVGVLGLSLERTPRVLSLLSLCRGGTGGGCYWGQSGSGELGQEGSVLTEGRAGRPGGRQAGGRGRARPTGAVAGHCPRVWTGRCQAAREG